jgi:hypothetical protein
MTFSRKSFYRAGAATGANIGNIDNMDLKQINDRLDLIKAQYGEEIKTYDRLEVGDEQGKSGQRYQDLKRVIIPIKNQISDLLRRLKILESSESSSATLPSEPLPSPASLPIPDLVLATATATALGTNIPVVNPPEALPSPALVSPIPDVNTPSLLPSSTPINTKGTLRRAQPQPEPEETIDKIENTLIQIWPDLVKIIGELSIDSSNWQDNKSNIIKYTQHIGAFSLLQNV